MRAPLAVAWLGIPCIWVLGFVSDNSDLGWLHFSAAGAGMGLIGTSGVLHGLCCVFMSADVWLNKCCRLVLYSSNIILCGLSLLSSSIWFMGDNESAFLEWLGFFLVLAIFSTYSVYFWGHAKEVAHIPENASLL